MSVKEVYLEGNPPWGFRMNGGADAGHPLRISRVNPGSKAESKGIREGDFITSINGQSTKCLTNSESHALLRTVKENLLLGLNEDKNSSPRRRSREIKSSTEGADEKEKFDSTTLTKGSKKSLSASQKRHQRRSRLNHRIKELFGFKTKKETESKLNNDEEWVIIDGYAKDLETKSVISYSSEQENMRDRAVSEPTDPEKIYDCFDFKTKQIVQGDVDNSMHFVELLEPEYKKPTVIITEPPVDETNRKQFHVNYVSNKEIIPEIKEVNKIEPLNGSYSVESVEVRYSTNVCPPNPKLAQEVIVHPKNFNQHPEKLYNYSNSWNFISHESESLNKSSEFPEGVQVSVGSVEHVAEEETAEALGLLRTEKMVELCNATIIIEDENTSSGTLNVLTTKPNVELKMSDLSDKKSIPDYEPVEVNSSVVIYPSYSSTINHYFPRRRYLEVISEENSDVSDGEKPWENSELIRKNNEVESIPQDWFGSQDGIDTSWRDGKSIEEMSDVPTVSDSQSDTDLLIDETKAFIKNGKLSKNINNEHKVIFTETDETKVKCAVDNFTNEDRKQVKSEHIVTAIPPSGKDKHPGESSRKVYKISSPSLNQFSRRHMKPVPSVSVVKNVISSYYNSSVPEKVTLNEKDSPRVMQPTKIELNTSIVRPASEKDIELVYIDSSDSEAFSSVSNLSLSNRTSLSVDKDDIEINEDASCDTIKHSTSNDDEKETTEDGSIVIINEVISNLQQTAEEISKIKLESPVNSLQKERKRPPPIQTKSVGEGKSLYRISHLVSPKMPKKQMNFANDVKHKRRFSFPFTGFDVCNVSDKLSNVILNVVNESTSIQPEKSLTSKKSDKPSVSEATHGLPELSNHSITPKGSSQNLNNAASQTDLVFLPMSPLNCERLRISNEDILKSSESIYYDFSEGSVSTESYYLPDLTEGDEIKESHSEKMYGISTSSPKFVARSPAEVSDIYDLHRKFVARRGYHENPPVKVGSSAEPDLIALSKCKDGREQAYTPELLAQAANLLALHNYHESRQKKMSHSQALEDVKERPNTAPGLTKINKSPQKMETSNQNIPKEKETDASKQGTVDKMTFETENNKSNLEENEAVGKSRLLELFQKLDTQSSNSECIMPEPCVDQPALSDPCESGEVDVGFKGTELDPLPKEGTYKEAEVVSIVASDVTDSSKAGGLTEKVEEGTKESHSQMSEDSVFNNSGNRTKTIRPKLSAPGEASNRKMYEEYMGKMAELVERRNLKIIKLSSRPNSSVSVPSDFQPLESEFMNKLKERNEKLGIIIEKDASMNQGEETEQNDKKDNLPKHLKELMEITEECGDIVGKDGLLVEIDEALSPGRKGFLTAKGVWSPAQTPEAERKKFDFSSEIREEKERERQKEKEEDTKKEPQPAVWTPRSAGASPTSERKYRTVNFQSPPTSRKEIKTPIDSPELPKELPIETDDPKSRLVSSSSENSSLSSALRLPTAQNPTITLLQKAREGQIPRGAQYIDEPPSQGGGPIGRDEIIYSVKKEQVIEDSNKKIVELGPKKIEGIGPTTKEGIPIVLRSEVKEDNQQRWYKRMYDSLHKADHDKDFVTVKYKTKRRGYPSIYTGGYVSEPERLGYDSDASISKYATLDRRRIRNKENDFTTSTLPRNRYAPGIKYAVNIYRNQPGRIEDYEPGSSSIAEKEKRQWWDEVMGIFDGELNEQGRSNQLSSSISGKPFTYSLKDTGYESDSTLVFKRRDNNMSGQLLSPAEQKMAYKVIQKGGDVPFQGLRKAAPERPKEPLGNPIPTPPRDLTSRQRMQESPHRYVESEVNIHYRSPIRHEQKAAWPEDELAQRQAEIMRRIYQEQRRTKYLNELHDMYSRRHADNLLPSQKSPIPLNRYDDFPVEVQPPRPRDRTPEPKLVARALYNFVGQSSRELSFRRGDIIYVRRQIDKNWYEGEHNAMIGLFPFNYVEIIPYDGIRTLPKKASEGQARAKFNFQAQSHLELSLVKGELVLLTRRVDENWFEGRIGNRKGIFPVSYVEVLVEPGERATSPTGSISTKPIVAPASHSVMLNGAKDLGHQHYQPPRPAIYTSSSLPPSSKLNDISMVNQALHIDTQSDPVPYRVLYNYRPQNEDELELKEGDVVYVMEKCDDGWYVGSLHRNGQFGTFPGNYVERIQ